MGRWLAAWFLSLALAAPVRAAVFVVQPSGDDDAAGTQSAPWRTIARGARALVAGDTLVVGAGVYDEIVFLKTSGAPGAPITVMGRPGATLVSPNPAASLSGFDVDPGVANLVIDGFTLSGFDETIMLRSGAHDIDVRRCVAEDGGVGIWIAGARDVTVEDCTLRHNRLGLRISGDSTRITVRGTTSSANDDGAGCSGDADGFSVEETVRDVLFDRCTAEGNGEDGFDLQGDAIRVLAAVSRDNGCSGLKLGQTASVENAVVVGNTTGIAVGSFFGAPVMSAIVNSVVADNSGTQLLLRSNAADPTRPSGVLLRNLLGAGDGKIVEAEWPLTLWEDHNLFFRRDTTSAAIVRHLADGEHRYTGQDIDAGIWAAESGQGAATLAIDPGFVDATYAVGADSAAIDRGAEDGAPSDDRNGNPRPQGGGVDIGPDESGGAIDNHRPWADPGPDRSIELGARLRVSAYGSIDPDGDPLSYLWSFGDGASASGASASHTYAAAGEFTLALTVSDGRLSHTRAAVVTVHQRFTATPTAGATATPTPTIAPAGHDSELRVASRRVRLRMRQTRPVVETRVVIVVRNDDMDPMPERPGHTIRVVVGAGTCPPDMIAAGPDFDAHQAGVQDEVEVEGGRQRRATIWLRADSTSMSAPLRCTLHVAAIGPDGDPTPENNAADVAVEVR